MRYISFRSAGKVERSEPGSPRPAADRPAFHADNWNMATAPRGA
ncbi:hypothetical protein FHT70_001554 [Rhizobium sp. BK049]|nr:MULTISPECIES: hypothetical protein [Rhizobium]MBB3351637.1 hypothetical protein [Rhizobium sp. BK049]